MIEWWNEISKRAQSSTFTQPGEGISRSGSVMRSSSVSHPNPATPIATAAAVPADHTQGPSPPYQEHHQTPVSSPPVSHAAVPVSAAASPVPAPATPVAAAAPAPAPVAAPAPDSPAATGSTISLNHSEPAAAAPASL